jgi:septum formation protein
MASSSSDDPKEGFGLPRPLILGSASFTRKLILKEMGIAFHIVVRPIDEKSLGDRTNNSKPEELVLELAHAKMNHLINEIQAGRCHDDFPESLRGKDCVVMTGDQVVVCNGRILEKPESIDEAKSFVAMYATHPPSTVGSVVLRHLPSQITVSGVDIATIHFKEDIPDDLVDKLLEDDAPLLSCAGGLMVEHELVKASIDHIDGTEDSVMGLSKALLTKLLQELALKLSAS